MGKGDKKSRRGKIIIGSYGVRRPKSSKNKSGAIAEVAVVETVEKAKKAIEKPKAEPKQKAKAAEATPGIEAEMIVPPKKAVKKAAKKPESEDGTEIE
jgi:ribosomal small subunit protein bTHX